LNLPANENIETLDLRNLGLYELPEKLNLAKVLYMNEPVENNFPIFNSNKSIARKKYPAKCIDLRGNPLREAPSWLKDLRPEFKVLLDAGVWKNGESLKPSPHTGY
jgi:hypothetical protein